MKAFILFHALFLGSGSEAARKKWQKSAAEIIRRVDSNRFYVCQGIMHSVFLRRQHAIRNPDTADAVDELLNVPVEELWPGATILTKPLLAEHFRQIMNPVTYTDPFWLPYAASLSEQVFTNLEKYFRETATFVRHMKVAHVGPVRAQTIQDLIKIVWGKLYGHLLRSGLVHQTSLALTDAYLDSDWYRIPDGYI
jgi:hypothetical protein